MGLRHSELRLEWPPPLNPEHVEAAAAKLPAHVLTYLAMLANSCAPFKTPLKHVLGRGGCWLSEAPPTPFCGGGSAGSSSSAQHRARHSDTQGAVANVLMGRNEELWGWVTSLHPLPHLALLGVGAPAEGALLQLLDTAPITGRELLEASTLQEAQLLGSAPLLQDLLLGLELGADTACRGTWSVGLGCTLALAPSAPSSRGALQVGCPFLL